MISDNIIIKLLSTRTNYFKFKKHLQWKALLEHTVQIVTDMETWFNRFPSSDEITWDEFSEWFRITLHPNYTEEESLMYATQFERIRDTEVDSAISLDIFKGLIERKYAKDIMELGIQVCHGNKSLTDIKSILDDCNRDISKVSTEVQLVDNDLVTSDIVELLSEIYGDDSTGLDWFLEEMNISLGPLRQGNSVLVAAYVDVGKTLFTLNCCRGFLPQFKKGEQILYFANEEPGKTAKLRFYQSILGWSSEQMRRDFSKTLTELEKRMPNYRDFILYHNGIMNTSYVEERIAKSNPGLLVIDQLHNVGGFEKTKSNVDKLEELAKWTRGLAQIAPCIFTHQADGQCNGVKFIELNQMYGSKVGIQGAVDAVITIGKELGGPQTELERGLYFPKNKLLGGRRCEDDKRKYKWNVSIQPELARFKGNV